MTDNAPEQDLPDYREEAEHTQDEPLSATATHPGWQRAKMLSVRLNPEEFDAVTRYAAALEVPASALVRGWITDQLRAGSDSPVRTVERIATNSSNSADNWWRENSHAARWLISGAVAG